jgi:uncharacterized surface protein with fasciclin (FAS1) repeats
MKQTRTIVFAILFGMTIAACSSGTDSAETTVAETVETTAAATTETTEAMSAEAGTIVDVATDAGTFTTLLAAAEAAGLVETLQGEGPYTVFAPTDEAFAALPEGTLDELLADPEALADILLYHVVPGEVMAADVVALDSATTAQGSDVAITVDGDMVMVNEANVTATDIDASNGVIHVIDAVILPPSS